MLSSSGICWWYDSYIFDYGYKIDPVDYADKLNIRYKEDYRFSERVSELEEKVANGDAFGGHAAEKLCLIQSESSLPTIYNLKYDDNVYAQFTALKAHKYFNRNEQVTEIATYMINNEIDSLDLKNKSYYGNYAAQATKELIDINPDLGLDYLFKLYLKYKSLYPSNYNHKLKHYQNFVTSEEREIIYSMNRADKIIEDYIIERKCRTKKIRKNPLYKKLEREITKYYP